MTGAQWVGALRPRFYVTVIADVTNAPIVDPPVPCASIHK
jgi:hypothetical protein